MYFGLHPRNLRGGIVSLYKSNRVVLFVIDDFHLVAIVISRASAFHYCAGMIYAPPIGWYYFIRENFVGAPLCPNNPNHVVFLVCFFRFMYDWTSDILLIRNISLYYCFFHCSSLAFPFCYLYYTTGYRKSKGFCT